MIPAILITAFIILIGRDCMLPADEPEDEEKVETLFSTYQIRL